MNADVYDSFTKSVLADEGDYVFWFYKGLYLSKLSLWSEDIYLPSATDLLSLIYPNFRTNIPTATHHPNPLLPLLPTHPLKSSSR